MKQYMYLIRNKLLLLLLLVCITGTVRGKAKKNNVSIPRETGKSTIVTNGTIRVNTCIACFLFYCCQGVLSVLFYCCQGVLSVLFFEVLHKTSIECVSCRDDSTIHLCAVKGRDLLRYIDRIFMCEGLASSIESLPIHMSFSLI